MHFNTLNSTPILSYRADHITIHLTPLPSVSFLSHSVAPEVFQLQKHKFSAETEEHLENVMFNEKVRILFSCATSWELFNAEKPRCVAISCEGVKKMEQLDGKNFPVMVVIASAKFIILEFPEENSNDMPGHNKWVRHGFKMMERMDEACLSPQVRCVMIH
jgi:hypothetical protein